MTFVTTACLLSAIQLVAGRMGKADNAKNAVVHASVHIGEPKGSGGFGLAVDIKVENVDEDVLEAGHKACVLIRSVFFFARILNMVLRSLRSALIAAPSKKALKSMFLKRNEIAYGGIYSSAACRRRDESRIPSRFVNM